MGKGSIETIATYGKELRRILTTTNRIIYRMDPQYVVYQWVSQLINSVRSLGAFVLIGVIASLFIGQTGQVGIAPMTVYAGIVGYFVYLMVGALVASWATERQAIFSSRLRTVMEVDRAEKLASLDLGRLLDPAFIELSSMASRRGMSAVHALWRAQLELVASAFALSLGAAVLLSIDPLIGVAALCMALPSVVQKWMQEQRRRVLDEQETLVHRMRSEVYWASTATRVAIFMRYLQLARKYLDRYKVLSEVLMDNVKALARFERRGTLLVMLISAIAVVAMLLYFASGIVAGQYTAVEIGAIVGSLSIAAQSLSGFGWSVGQIEQERLDYLYLERFLETKSLVDESHCVPMTLEKTPELVLEDVAFTYPTGTVRAVDTCSLNFKPGEKVAFVGPNGCGKTTLLRLIGRAYVPSQGRIWVDQHAADQVLQQSWIEHVMLVQQSVMLPGMEVGRAITGVTADEIDKDRLGLALYFSGAAPLMDTMPHGLETWIGEEWPQGKGFSTGELQRLALAAAFYRLLSPSVYVAMFDEPTANCDAETKARFFQSVSRAPEFADKTIIVTIHDPMYLKLFDRVVQFEKGKVIRDLRGKDQIEQYRSQIESALMKDLS